MSSSSLMGGVLVVPGIGPGTAVPKGSGLGFMPSNNCKHNADTGVTAYGSLIG